MSACAVMLVKDEADVIEHTVRHNIQQLGRVIVADNVSTDGTFETLMALKEEYGSDVLSARRDYEVGHYQSEKTTALAMEALREGHRWVIPCDADELWLAPDGRRIIDWLDGVGREIQFIKAVIYNHVATARDDQAELNPFARICWRQRTHLEMRWGKVCCRLREDLVIHDGNHSASTTGTGTQAQGLEIRHFPYRSPEQFVKKARNGYAALRATDRPEDIGAHWRSMGRAIEQGGDEAGRAWFRDSFWSDDPERDDSLVFNPAPLSVPL